MVQANRWLQGHPSVTLCPLTCTLLDTPLVPNPVKPKARNRLKEASKLIADRMFTVPTTRIGELVGVLEPD